MMSRIFSFLLGVAAGVCLCYGASNFHLLRADDGFHVVRKVDARLADAYVDIRAFGADDWAAHPELAAAVLQEDKQELMNDAAVKSIRDGLQQALPAWAEP